MSCFLIIGEMCGIKGKQKKRNDCGGRIKSSVGVDGERKSLRTSVSVSSSGKMLSTAK